ncbi:MAG: hypothetical protein WBQ65_09750, partial [Bryobacteraceae bacterium]
MDLTPEERQRIYAEEKARIEARERINAEQDRIKLAYKAEQHDKSVNGCLRISLVMAAVLIAIVIAGSLIKDKPGAEGSSSAEAERQIVCDEASHGAGLGVTKADYDALAEANAANDKYGA